MLSDPGELIAAIPAILGFTPTDSVIAVGIRGGSVHCALRMDADVLTADPAGYADLASTAQNAGVESVIGIVVGHADASERFTFAFATMGIGVLGTFQVSEIAPGARWHGCGMSGIVPDPRASKVACDAVASGRVIHESREEIAARFAHCPNPAVDDALGAIGDLPAAGALTALLAGITGTLTAHGIALAAIVAMDGGARDALYGLALSSIAAEVERAYTAAARSLSGEYRAAALAMVAFYAYCREDGPTTGIAVDAALAADASNTMAKLIDTALRGGIRPDAMRALAAKGRDKAMGLAQ